jgi:imidazolonepropionase-like amidohydrolase
MRKRILLIDVLLIAACGAFSPGGQQRPELALNHVAVLDVRSGKVLPNRLVLVSGGVITAVVDAGGRTSNARRVIDGHGRLLTPGLIDAHLHLCSIFCPPGSDSLTLSMKPDSIAAYWRTLAAEYLPYGVTAVRDVGTEERMMPLLLAWTRRSSSAPDFYPVGAHIISPQRNGYHAPWQVVVSDSAAAAAKVREYYSLGIRNIKLYWRLREPEFRGALYEAQKLGMNVTGHVDQGVMTIDRALDLGLRNVEHLHTFGYSVLTRADFDSLMSQVPRTLGVIPPRFPPTALFMNVAEIFNYLGPDNARILALIEKFKATNSSLTPTLHVFAQRYGLTYFASAPRDSTEDTSVWTRQQRERTIAGYRIMASYIKRMYDAGIRLNVGTDTPEPGKSVLSEMLLLHDAGIPMTGVFRIATVDSAEDIGHGAEYGAIEAGMRANLILFDGDPLARPLDLLGGKTVIKDGAVVSTSDTARRFRSRAPTF